MTRPMTRPVTRPMTRLCRDDLGLPRPHAAPLTPSEAALCDAYAAALNLDRVGRDDDFFDLGGDSLGAERLAGLAARAGLPPFPAVKLFTLGTPGALAAWLMRDQAAPPANPATVSDSTSAI